MNSEHALNSSEGGGGVGLMVQGGGVHGTVP